jgi:chromosome segregation ATPase
MTMANLTSVIIGGLSAIGGGILTEVFRWIAFRKSRKITDASKLIESATTVVHSYDRLVEDLRESLQEQKGQIEGLQAQQIQDRLDIAVLQDENEHLARQIEALHRDYQDLVRKYQNCQERLKNQNDGSS